MKREIVTVTVEYKYELEYSHKKKREEALDLINREVPCGRTVSGGSGSYVLTKIDQVVQKVVTEKKA